MPATIDLSRDRSPKTVQRALETYGERIDDPRYQVFASLVARGEPGYKAYMALFPEASEATASKQASILTAHPAIRRWIALEALGTRRVVESLVPAAIERMAQLMEDDTAAAGTRLTAAMAIADRGGLPMRKNVAVSATATVHAIYARHTGEVASAARHLAPERRSLAARTEGATQKERESWRGLMPG